MSPTARKIEADFKKLPREEQDDLAGRLLALTQRAEDEALSPARQAEIDRRLREIDSGKASGRDAFEVLDELTRTYS